MTTPNDKTNGAARSRGWPLALVTALVLLLCVEAWLWATRRAYLLDDPLIYDVKLERIERKPDDRVVVLGASAGMAALRVELLGPLPGGATVYNYSLPGMGPAGGEIVLRRLLAAGGHPDVVVLTYSAAMMADADILFGWEGRFQLLYRLGDVLSTLREGAHPSQALTWLATRPPSVRYRTSIRSAALAHAVDAAPTAAGPLRGLLGHGGRALSPFQFDWLYRRRGERNAAFVRELEEERGWRYFRNHALPGERLPTHGVRFRAREFRIRDSEQRALEKLVALCATEGIAILVAPAPLPVGLVEALGEPGAVRMDRLFEEVYDGRTGVRIAGAPLPGYPHRDFADRLHVNPDGARRYTTAVAGPLRALLDELQKAGP